MRCERWICSTGSQTVIQQDETIVEQVIWLLWKMKLSGHRENIKEIKWGGYFLINIGSSFNHNRSFSGISRLYMSTIVQWTPTFTGAVEVPGC